MSARRSARQDAPRLDGGAGVGAAAALDRPAVQQVPGRVDLAGLLLWRPWSAARRRRDAASAEADHLRAQHRQPCAGELEGEGVVVGEDRRFAHAQGWLRTRLDEAGFTILAFDAVSTRQDRGAPVPGFLVVAERR